MLSAAKEIELKDKKKYKQKNQTSIPIFIAKFLYLG